MKCLNPFYIRSRIPTPGKQFTPKGQASVSIPFTSGHVFRREKSMLDESANPVSQSLLHQVTYSDYGNCAASVVLPHCLNPFYIRSRIPTIVGDLIFDKKLMSQSLLHQVTYSDLIQIGEISFSFDVSIPFTSGHVFRHPKKPPAEKKEAVSQSLLHQVTYSDCRPKTGVQRSQKSQSLLHQVTYSDSISMRFLSST